MNPTGTTTLRAATRADGAEVRHLAEEVLGEFGFSLEPDGTDADLEASYSAETGPGWNCRHPMPARVPRELRGLHGSP